MPREQLHQFVFCLSGCNALGCASPIDLRRIDVFNADFLAAAALVAQDETVTVSDKQCHRATRRLFTKKGRDCDVVVLGGRAGAGGQAGDHHGSEAPANVTPPSSRRD
jgi:hypothetical protein